MWGWYDYHFDQISIHKSSQLGYVPFYQYPETTVSMSGGESLREILQGIASAASEDMSERDVENLFLEGGFYQELGYEGTGADIRSEWTLPDDRRPDYITLDEHEAVTAVYEFKTTGRDLSPHTDQLFGYMDDLKAEYGVLTNGDRIELYERNLSSPILAVPLAAVSDSQARDLASALRKPAWDITDPESVNAFVAGLDPVGLDSELGQDHFFDTFRLEEDSPFADLVVGMMDLLSELRDEQDAKFVSGAYDFWEASYASVPDDVPNSWEPFLEGQSSLRDFMFCLESGHALLARLLLAKACEDRDFFPPNTGINEYFRELQGFGSRIDLDAYPVAAQGLLGEMQQHLVESLFEDDIFIWWTDGYQEETTSLHESPHSRFSEVAAEGSDITRVSQATRERFSRAVAQVFFATLKFDFADVAGDPLGDLYQHYFDPETRKALGEFYTPQEVVEYILDGVGYETGISNERLIDPACGSGTFLVEAIRRYLDDVRRYEDDPDWSERLMELCSRPHIVGLDIHPFAVLMAQIRFMITILPEYREAKREDPDFTIRRLPIFRTDTLRNERESTGLDLGDDDARQMTFDAMTEDSQDVLIPVPLPIEVEADEDVEREGDFLVQRVRMPLFDTIRLETGVRNFGEYFAALQGVLDVVKFHMSEDEWEYVGGLEQGINRYTSREYEGVEGFFAPYVDDILSTMRYLDREHGDGRLFKMFEDSVLALVVKNYMDYEYVVGNPPYVRQENLRKEDKVLYKEMYPDVYDGRGDISVYFLKRATEFATDEGRVGFIVSINFTTSNYGEGIRSYLSDNVTIDEVIDFADTEVFADAIAYPMIFIFENHPPKADHQFDYCLIDSGVEGLDNPMAFVFNNVHTDNEHMKSFLVSQDRLKGDEWRFLPESLFEVTEKIYDRATHSVEGVGRVVTGIRPGLNDAFILDEEVAEKHGIEPPVLKECIKAKDTERYHIPNCSRRVIYTPILDPQLHTNAFEYISGFEEELKNREQFKNRDDMEWWEIEQPVSPDVFERKKLITPAFSKRNRFAYDDRNLYHVDMVMSILLNQRYESDEAYFHLLAILNSKTVEIVFKQSATLIQGKYYRYYRQQINPLPLVFPDDDFEPSLARLAETAIESRKTAEHLAEFPGPYLSDFEGEIEYISHTWQSRRYPVNAEFQSIDNGLFSVNAGRTDSITGPQIDSEERARYVHAAVDGRNVKSGEEQTIPIPRRDDDVSELLAEWEEDRATVEETDIAELEAEIDEIVYDLFDLTEDEREVIEEYLEVF